MGVDVARGGCIVPLSDEVGYGWVEVVMDGVDAVVDVVGGREVVATGTDGLDVLGLFVDGSLDETALAVARVILKKKKGRRWTLLLLLLMVVEGQDAARR